MTLRHLPGLRRPRRRAPALAEQIRNTHEVRARLRPELVRQPRLEPPVHLEGVAPIAHPRPGLDDATHRILGQRVELEQALPVVLDGFEVADPTPAVHLLHEAIADPGHQLGAPFVLPLLELHGTRHLEPAEVPGAVQVGQGEDEWRAKLMPRIWVSPASSRLTST